MERLGDDVTVLQSLCMNCQENGETRLLLIKIPHFRDVMVSSFRCKHCSYSNNDVQSTGVIQEQGQRLKLVVVKPGDLNRQVIKSESCSLAVPELGLELPKETQRGSLNTIEGVLSTAAEGIRSFAKQQMKLAAGTDQLAEVTGSSMQLFDFCDRLEAAATGKQLPFTIVLDDPAGNSYIENPFAPETDPQLTIERYWRSTEQQELLGLQPGRPSLNPVASISDQAGQTSCVLQVNDERTVDKLTALVEENFDPSSEVLEFPSVCSDCGQPGQVKMLVTNIPHFREVILMAFTCKKCGYRTNEVRGGGGISPFGRRTTLTITTPEDLNRDILKSESAGLRIPVVGLKLAPGTLGGKFTTIEGLLQDIQSGLSFNPFLAGDSSEAADHDRMSSFQEALRRLTDVSEPYQIILDDPLANSFIQNIYAPDPDPNMQVEEYTRTWQQDEKLGLHHMNVGENHAEVAAQQETADETAEESTSSSASSSSSAASSSSSSAV